MQLFRRTIDLSQAYVRVATNADLNRITHLLRDAGRRYYGLNGRDLPRLLAATPAILFETSLEPLAFVITDWRTDCVTWLRCFALARGLDVRTGVESLLPALHAELRLREIQRVFYAGDETTDQWLAPVLRDYGYVVDTRVVVYEKHSLALPTQGNPHSSVRPARLSDLDALVALDSACFEAHWTKNEAALSSAIADNDLCIVAEHPAQSGRIIGYAYATSHFQGRLVHLVRIAVRPQQRHAGIGARLLSEVIGFARQQNADVITLNTQSYNEPAQRLYRWFGFAPNGESQTVLRYDL
jgi:ribosomal protein S18 acetylase RimI-like enzyme